MHGHLDIIPAARNEAASVRWERPVGLREPMPTRSGNRSRRSCLRVTALRVECTHELIRRRFGKVLQWRANRPIRQTVEPMQ